MRNETPVRQGEYGRRSGFLPFGVDPCTNCCDLAPRMQYGMSNWSEQLE
jgi:hypothetical protein